MWNEFNSYMKKAFNCEWFNLTSAMEIHSWGTMGTFCLAFASFMHKPRKAFPIFIEASRVYKNCWITLQLLPVPWVLGFGNGSGTFCQASSLFKVFLHASNFIFIRNFSPYIFNFYMFLFLWGSGLVEGDFCELKDFRRKWGNVVWVAAGSAGCVPCKSWSTLLFQQQFGECSCCRQNHL